jgi:predicted  nucleic acid-binding Zn-ribbon protein
MVDMDELKMKVASLETAVEDLKTKDERILEELAKINQTLARQKGFLGGVMFVFSCLAAAVGLTIDFLRK